MVRAWQDAWDTAARTNIFSIGTSAFNWPVKIEDYNVPSLEWYLDISREYQCMTFEEARARALRPQEPLKGWNRDSPGDAGVGVGETRLKEMELTGPYFCFS